MKRLLVDPGRCDGCGSCELVCAVEKASFWHPALSRIRIVEDREVSEYRPVVCSHCEDSPCKASCLMNIVARDENRGITVREENKCIGCRACQVSCPFDSCVYDYVSGRVVSCDLCGGEPACALVCATGALRYEPAELQNEDRRRNAARILILEEGQYTEPVREKRRGD